MTARPWYRTADMLPPLNVWCEVSWYGRHFRAARRPWGRSKAVAWATFRDDGTLRRLPPKRQAEAWGEHPQYYRPVEPDSWPGRLPAPAAVDVEGELWSSRGSGRRIAAEKFARAVVSAHEVLERDVDHFVAGENWWRDANAIVYQPPGQITVRMAEARILRFVSFVGAGMHLDGPERPESALQYLTEEQVRDFAQFEADGKIVVSRFPKLVETENDRRDEDQAGRWFLALNPPKDRHKHDEPWSLNRSQRLLRWRAAGPPLSWRRIADELWMSHFQARHEYAAVIFRVYSVANGKPMPWNVSRADREWILRIRKTVTAGLEAA